MDRRSSRLASLIDAVHYAVIVFWVGGFALYPWLPRFRFVHALFVVFAASHQILLGNRCILTVISRRLRRETSGQVFVNFLPNWLNTALTWATVLAALLTLIICGWP